MSTRTGTITHDGEKAIIAFERPLAFPIDVVWAALTQPEQRARWFGSTIINAREGGTIETVAEGPSVSPEHRRVQGRILVWNPPHVFEHEWHQSIVGKTLVRYELAPDGGSTILRLTHSLLTPRNAQGFIPGTHAYLDRLEAHLEGSPLPKWTQRYSEVQLSYG